jgi:two-component system response regulator CssR
VFRIFLVEDESNLNQVLATYLRNEGWEVETFMDGNEARKALKESLDSRYYAARSRRLSIDP